jgi:ArsR family transcriptional regulator, arsenate/arsenite/antimonite-responsive transcriptional repressor
MYYQGMPTPTTAVPILQKLKAVADESRLAILNELAAGERCVCDLMEDLDLKQPLLSFHLKILKEAGLITCRRDGRWCYYAVSAEAFRELCVDLGALASTPKRKGRRVCC